MKIFQLHNLKSTFATCRMFQTRQNVRSLNFRLEYQVKIGESYVFCEVAIQVIKATYIVSDTQRYFSRPLFQAHIFYVLFYFPHNAPQVLFVLLF